MTETINKFPVHNLNVVFREEGDDWGVLFNPDSGEIYGLDPISIFVWKKLDGRHSIEEIVNDLRGECIGDIPECVLQDVTDFVNDLASNGLIFYENQSFMDD